MAVRKPYEGTKVSVAKSSEEIRQKLKKHGAHKIVIGETWEETMAVEWLNGGIQYRVEMPMSDDDEPEEMRLWRVMFWAIKSKIESVESGMETYEMAFLAQMVDPASGKSLSKIVQPMIEAGAFDYGGQGLKALPA